jgi:hypothetical protein
MHKKYFLLLMAFIVLLIASCSKRILEAKEVHKLHDEYFILRKNGRYSTKMLMMGTVRMPDSEHGRYILSGDTVYFINKLKGKKIFETYGYGIIDTNAQQFNYMPNDSIKRRYFSIQKMTVGK